MKALKEILANKDIIQKVRDLNFGKEEKRIDETQKSRREKDNDLKKLVCYR